MRKCTYNFYCLMILAFTTSMLTSCEKSDAVIVSSIDELRCSDQNGPIQSRQEAICFAVNLSEIKKSLEERKRTAENQNLQFNGWSIKVKRKGSEHWEVTIKSSRYIPTYSCKVTLTNEGTVIGNINCQYAK